MTDCKSRISKAVTLASALVLVGLLLPLHRQPAPVDAAHQEFAAEESNCATVQELSTDRAVLLGEPATVQAWAGAICAGKLVATDLALVIDGSAPPSSAVGEELKELAKQITEHVDSSPWFRVGVIEYDASADVLCELTQNRSDIWACIDRVGETRSNSANPVSGVARGVEMLGPAIADPVFYRAVLVLLSGASPPGTCPSLVEVVSRARSDGVWLLGASLGAECDPVCFSRAFGRYDYSGDTAEIRRDLFGLGPGVVRLDVTHFTLTLTLPTALAPIADSMDPPGSVWYQTVEWTLGPEAGSDRIPSEFTATLRALPRDPGWYPDSLEAVLTLRDSWGRTKAVPLDPASILILRPEEVDPMRRVYLPWAGR